jgi:Ulp1 family protease
MLHIMTKHVAFVRQTVKNFIYICQAGRAQNDVSSPKNDSAEPSEVETPNTTPNKTSTVAQSPEKPESDDSEAGKKFDVATKDELLQLAKKQEKALTRYKTKFSEVQYTLQYPNLMPRPKERSWVRG